MSLEKLTKIYKENAKESVEEDMEAIEHYLCTCRNCCKIMKKEALSKYRGGTDFATGSDEADDTVKKADVSLFRDC